MRFPDDAIFESLPQVGIWSRGTVSPCISKGRSGIFAKNLKSKGRAFCASMLKNVEVAPPAFSQPSKVYSKMQSDNSMLYLKDI